MQSSRVGKYTIYYENAEEWRVVKREVFTEHVYYSELGTENPVILDLGAYIGDTVLYFKQLYPEARITAVEPLPENLMLLTKNIEENQLEDVEIVEALVGEKDGEAELYADENANGWYSMAGVRPGGWGGQQKSKRRYVRSVTLDSLIKGQVDLLKMDIEGAEEAVLGASQKLEKVRKLIVEYHPAKGHDERGLVNFLERQGYLIEVRDDPDKRGQGLKILSGVRR